MPHRLVYYVPDEHVPSEDGWARPGAQRAGGPVGRATRFALEATRQAMTDAGLGDVAPSRLAVAIGTGMGDAGLHEQWRLTGAPPMQQWTPEFSVAAAVGAAIGAGGPNASISNACAASGFALSVAADLIESGEADVVVAGGAEGYSRVALGCFNRLGAIDPERCRPFDRERAGTVFGEGAAMLVLEAEEHALERGAPRVYARVAGAGWSCDAYHMTAPEPRGEQILRALRDALRRAGGDADAIGCVVPHGTGTELNDVVEANALRALLGPRCDTVPLYSLKGLIGHTGGAAGAFAALASALILAHGEVPANVALGEQDPECDVLVAEEPLALVGPLVVLNAYAFGGNNVSLALEAA
jgi:3-oxoacyl-[acyl-carrier-protein] synthase II